MWVLGIFSPWTCACVSQTKVLTSVHFKNLSLRWFISSTQQLNILSLWFFHFGLAFECDRFRLSDEWPPQVCHTSLNLLCTLFQCIYAWAPIVKRIDSSSQRKKKKFSRTHLRFIVGIKFQSLVETLYLDCRFPFRLWMLERSLLIIYLYDYRRHAQIAHILPHRRNKHQPSFYRCCLEINNNQTTTVYFLA